MKRILPVLTALPFVIAFGVAEGHWTDRWSMSDEIEQAAARLSGIPTTVGDWEGKDEQLEPRIVAQAEIKGHRLQRYVHRRTGATLTVLLVCGRPGPTSVHTPDICFPGAGYGMAAPAERQGMAASGLDGPDEFWVARFQKGGDVADPMRAFWAWNATGAWVASDHPRFQFGRYSFLYKLYVTNPAARSDEPNAADPSIEFLAVFLPEVQKCLFPTPEAP